MLQPQDPFEEEKGESRTPSSCPTTPGMDLFSEFKQCYEITKEIVALTKERCMTIFGQNDVMLKFVIFNVDSCTKAVFTPSKSEREREIMFTLTKMVYLHFIGSIHTKQS